ncbi:MAG: hypothetical protein OXI74_07585 [Rhodospirillaceae bacterium]|nr:hypothetical protein [Rhodospirillaceae bacterium]
MHEDPSSGAPGTPAGDDGPVQGERIGDFVRKTASALGSNTGRAVRSDLGIYAA